VKLRMLCLRSEEWRTHPMTPPEPQPSRGFWRIRYRPRGQRHWVHRYTFERTQTEQLLGDLRQRDYVEHLTVERVR